MADRLASPGYLAGKVFGVKGGLLDINILPGHIQFLGNDHRHGGLHPLPYFRVGRKNGNRAIIGNLDKGIEIVIVQGSQVYRGFHPGLAGFEQIKADQQPSPRKGSGFHETSSAESLDRSFICHFERDLCLC
jgi:hypothetical protein